MGTRHLICVFSDGEYKVAQYGQWDGYPEGQGVDALNFLLHEFKRDVFLEKLKMVSFGTQEQLMAQWKECGADDSGWVSFEVSNLHREKYPENSRDTGAKILKIIQETEKPLLLCNSLDFAADSLFCEWSYVIDLDKNTFEVFKGFNTEPLNENERFYHLKYDPKHRTEKYYPVRLVESFNLNNLPTVEEFLNKFRDEEKDEDG